MSVTDRPSSDVDRKSNMPQSAVIVEQLQSLAVPIDNLQEDPENARRGDVAAIRRSLNVFGQRKPVVVKRTGVDAAGRPTGIVIAGNHTFHAACDLEWSHIAAVFVDDDESTARAYALADNRTGELATWDDEQLSATLRALDATDFDMETLGWSNDDLAALLSAGPYDDDNDSADSSAADDDDAAAPIEPLVFPNETIVAAAFEHFRASGYPLPNVPRYAAMQEINALAATDTVKLLGTNVAYHVADKYQPHRFSTRVQKMKTPLEVFESDASLTHAFRLTLEDRPISDGSLRSAMNFVHGAQTAAQFRPGFALMMYRRFAPAGGTVLDTSTGFGGRLTGFFASHCETYIGIDPNTVTSAGNTALANDLCPADKTVELHCLPAEDVPHEALAGRAHFAFTSPPYFAKELYSDEATQSCVRYRSAEDWRTGFLVPMLGLQFVALLPGAYSCVNIADVKLGSETHPLVQWTIDAALDVGFTYERTEEFPLSRVPGRGEQLDAFESVIVLRRPERKTS